MAESEVHVSADEEQVTAPRPSINFIDRALSFLSSVKFGITIMLVLIFFSIIGTLIIQYNIEGFDKYYASLTPAQRQLYHTLDLFDLYHSWWFNSLLILFSLNIVLVSIDLFPKAWRYVTEPAIRATPAFLRSQPVYRSFRLADDEGISGRLSGIFRGMRYRVKVTGDDSLTTVFGQKGLWNRFLVFVVHISVLVILGAAFVGSRWGYEGVLPLAPGEQADAFHISGAPVLGVPDRNQPLPFQVQCNNIRVDLKDPDGPLQQGNFRNWYTDVTFIKGDQRETASIYLNSPVDYEGYRFFQASFSPNAGEASDVSIEITSPDGGTRDVKLVRNQPVEVDGLGQVTFVEFRANILDQRQQAQDYSRPVAELDVVKPGGEKVRTAAFTTETRELIRGQSMMAPMAEQFNVDGHTLTLKEFTRAPLYHVLQVQFDPGVDWTYFGYTLLCVTLIAVFMFSHSRVWGVIEKTEQNGTILHVAGHANRNQLGFERKFEALIEQVRAFGVEEIQGKNGKEITSPSA